jgi:tight adherence protein C
MLPPNLVKQVDRMLVMANEPWSLTGFLSVWALSVLVGVLIIIYLATASSNLSGTQMFALSVLVIPFSILIPYAVLRRRVKNRQRALILSLPDGLDLLITCVEAGIGVDSAFALVTEKSDGPLADTFSLYLRQVGLGRARRDALAYVAERSGVDDLTSLAAAVAQAEELGTTLGDVLRVQADELRLARRQRAQTAAQRAPVLMTIPLALCFLPAMGAVIVVPSILNLIDFAGHLGGR